MKKKEQKEIQANVDYEIVQKRNLQMATKILLWLMWQMRNRGSRIGTGLAR